MKVRVRQQLVLLALMGTLVAFFQNCGEFKIIDPGDPSVFVDAESVLDPEVSSKAVQSLTATGSLALPILPNGTTISGGSIGILPYGTLSAASASGLTGDYGYKHLKMGNRLFVYGGCSDVGCSMKLNQGAVYDFTSNQWYVMNRVNAPDLHSNALFVANDRFAYTLRIKETLQFNGPVPSDVAEGEIFDVLLNSWVTYTVKRPFGIGSDRALQFYGVPAGDQLIFWGGYDFGAQLPFGLRNTGFVYSFSSRTTTLISEEGAPPARVLGRPDFLPRETGRLLIYGGTRMPVNYNISECQGSVPPAKVDFVEGGAIYNTFNNTWATLGVGAGLVKQAQYRVHAVTNRMVKLHSGYTYGDYNCETRKAPRIRLPGAALLDTQSASFVNAFPNLPATIEHEVKLLSINDDSALYFDLVNDSVNLGVGWIVNSAARTVRSFNVPDAPTRLGTLLNLNQRALVSLEKTQGTVGVTTPIQISKFDLTLAAWQRFEVPSSEIPEGAVFVSHGNRVYILGGRRLSAGVSPWDQIFFVDP